ncbi:MAG: VTT domain-containing protein [Chloroflexi bacterium]|nr:VTT domain-containing protein [Chloroflexota bacterium]
MATERKNGEAEVRTTLWRRRFPRILALAVVFVVLVSIVLLRERLTNLDALGYPSIFLVSVFSSGSVVIPMPGMLVVIVGANFLNPLFVGLLAGIGEALGEIVGYLLGYGGSGVMEKREFYSRVVGWMRRRGWLVIFLASSIPNPVFDVIGVAAGALRYPVVKFFLFCWVGKTIKSLYVAYAAYWGLTWLIELVKRISV